MVELKAVYTANDWVRCVRLMAWEDFKRLESYGNLGLHETYAGAVNHESRAGETVPVLHLGPAPVVATPLTVLYRDGWSAIGSHDAPLEMPHWAEEGFLDLVRAMALGLTRPSSTGNPDPMIELIAQVRAGDGFQMAIEQDGMIAPKVKRGKGALDEIMGREQAPGKPLIFTSQTFDPLADL